MVEQDLKLFRQIEQCLRTINDKMDLGTNDRGRRIQFSSHIVSEAVAKAFKLQVVHGVRNKITPHSWVLTRYGNVIDFYPAEYANQLSFKYLKLLAPSSQYPSPSPNELLDYRREYLGNDVGLRLAINTIAGRLKVARRNY